MGANVSGVNPFGSSTPANNNTQKTGSSFLDRIKTLSLFSADEKASKQEFLNNALINRNSIFE